MLENRLSIFLSCDPLFSNKLGLKIKVTVIFLIFYSAQFLFARFRHWTILHSVPKESCTNIPTGCCQLLFSFIVLPRTTRKSWGAREFGVGGLYVILYKENGTGIILTVT